MYSSSDRKRSFRFYKGFFYRIYFELLTNIGSMVKDTKTGIESFEKNVYL